MRVTQHLFSQVAKNFGHPPLCLSISPPTSFLWCATKDWLTSTKATTLQVESLLLSCTKVWCFCSWDNGGIQLQTTMQMTPHVLWNQGYTMHKKSHDVPNYTMHTKMSLLEEWPWTKASIVTLTTSSLCLWFESADTGSQSWVIKEQVFLFEPLMLKLFKQNLHYVQCTQFCS